MGTRTTRSYLKLAVGILFILIISTYTYTKSGDFIKGPSLTILSPQDGILLEEPLVEIRGKVERISSITINDNPIFVDESGNFNEQLLMSYGQNIITIRAEDKFERVVEEVLKVVYK
jgi:hypothetical protein